jgi:molybdenum cofactor cytidylyltransferase
MSDPRVAVIVLAAGRSSRFGAPDAHKLLATVNGTPIVRRSVRVAIDAGVGDVVVVTGFQRARIEAALHGLAVRVAHEPAFGDGMAVSLSRGLRAVQSTADAVLIALGDQPTMRAEAYRRVVTAWRASPGAVVVPRYGGRAAPAHPVLFGAETFSELLALRGDVGARDVIARDPGRVVMVDLEWPAPRDVDTTDDLAELQEAGSE